MSHRSRRRVSLLLASALLLAAKQLAAQVVVSDDPIDKSGPHAEQMAQDLVGQHFFYYIRAAGPDTAGDAASGAWTVKQNQLRKLIILQRFEDLRKGNTTARTDEVQALVTLAGSAETIRGILSFLYVRVNQQWMLVYVGARDRDGPHGFSFERIRKKDNALIAEMQPVSPTGNPARFMPSVADSARWPFGRNLLVPGR